MLSHRKPTSSHHNVHQFHSHTSHQTRGSLSSPQVFPPMLQQRKEKRRQCRRAEKPPSHPGGVGSWGCCSLVKYPVLKWTPRTPLLLVTRLQKTVPERADKRLGGCHTSSWTHLSLPCDGISPGGHPHIPADQLSRTACSRTPRET